MGQLTADDIVSALTVCCAEAPGDLAEAVALVRQAEPSLAPTLYSAWQLSGAQLPAALAHEVELARARTERYRRLVAQVRAAVTGLTPLKGIEVADRYPAGLVRSMNDIDLVAATELDLWRATAGLIADGWRLHAAVFAKVAGALQVAVSLRYPHESPYVLPYGVEIATFAALGDLGRVPPVCRLPNDWRSPMIKNLLMLLFERFEQRFRARDLVDAVLLLDGASPGELAILARAVSRLSLQPEYAELAKLVGQTRMRPLPLAPAGPLAVYAARARRAARWVGTLRRPLGGVARHLQRRKVHGRITGPERWVWAVAQVHLRVAPALRAGLLAFGLPLNGDPPKVDQALLRRRGELSWVDTPVARFMVTIGDFVPPSGVTQLTAELAAAATGRAPG